MTLWLQMPKAAIEEKDTKNLLVHPKTMIGRRKRLKSETS